MFGASYIGKFHLTLCHAPGSDLSSEVAYALATITYISSSPQLNNSCTGPCNTKPYLPNFYCRIYVLFLLIFSNIAQISRKP